MRFISFLPIVISLLAFVFIEISCNLRQWAKAIIFDQALNVLAQKNCPAAPAELKAYLTAYDSRDNTIGAGTYYCFFF